MLKIFSYTMVRISPTVLSAIFFFSAPLLPLSVDKPVAQEFRTTFFGPTPQMSDSNVAVIAESLCVSCIDSGHWLNCHLQNRLIINNSSPNSIDMVLEFDTLSKTGGVLKLNDTPVRIVHQEGTMVNSAAVRLSTGKSILILSIPHAFRINAKTQDNDLFKPVLATRHPLLNQYPRTFSAEFLLESAAMQERWKSVGTSIVVFNYPSDYTVKSSFDPKGTFCDCADAEAHKGNLPDSNISSCQRKAGHDRKELVWIWHSSEQNKKPSYRITLKMPTRKIFNGGPSLGGGIGYGNQYNLDAVRMMASYEIGWEPAWILSLTYEYSNKTNSTIIPAAEYGIISHLGFLPASTLGIGLPIHVNDSVEYGLRLQSALTWPLGMILSLGVHLSVDFYFNNVFKLLHDGPFLYLNAQLGI